jgi:hypothetical protein
MTGTDMKQHFLHSIIQGMYEAWDLGVKASFRKGNHPSLGHQAFFPIMMTRINVASELMRIEIRTVIAKITAVGESDLIMGMGSMGDKIVFGLCWD